MYTAANRVNLEARGEHDFEIIKWFDCHLLLINLMMAVADQAVIRGARNYRAPGRRNVFTEM